jgi:hypothetical protein
MSDEPRGLQRLAVECPKPDARPVKEPCCEAWAKAHEWETDNEAYSSLVRYSDDERALLGMDLPPVKFCPWCGNEKAPLNDYTDLRERKV